LITEDNCSLKLKKVTNYNAILYKRSKNFDKRPNRGQKICAAGSRPSRQGVVTILATKPNASSFPAIVLLLCKFTDEDKKSEIVVTLFGVLQGVDNRPTVARDLRDHVCYVTVRI